MCHTDLTRERTRRLIHRGFLERVYDSARRLGFRQKVDWPVSSRRGALHYFRDLSFGGLSEAHPGTTAVLVDELDAGCFQGAADCELIRNG